MAVSLYLSAEERNILLKRIPEIHKTIRTRLQLGVVDKQGLSFDFEVEEFYELVDVVELQAAMTDDKDLITILMKLHDVLDADPNLDPDYWDDEEYWEDNEEYEEEEDDEEDDYGNFEGNLDELTALGERMRIPDEIVEDIRQKLLERQPKNEMELQAILEEVMHAHIMRPMPDFDNLTPDQLKRMLMIEDWGDPDSVIRLREDMPAELLQNSIMLDNALLFLRMAHEQDGVKATAKGNLNRKFVQAIRPLLKGTDIYGFEDDDMRVHWNEEDIRALVVLRHLLEMAGLLRKTKGIFKVTRKGERMLAPEKAGALLAALFHAYYRKLNIAFVDFLEPIPSIQIGIVYSLLMLKRYASDYTALANLKHKLFLPFVWDEMPDKKVFDMEYWGIVAGGRIIRPLRLFGLLESEGDKILTPALDESTKIKTSPLFDALIDFKL